MKEINTSSYGLIGRGKYVFLAEKYFTTHDLIIKIEV
jgi:hypothetical protein